MTVFEEGTMSLYSKDFARCSVCAGCSLKQKQLADSSSGC